MAESKSSNPKKPGAYDQLIEHIFLSHYVEGVSEIDFVRDDLISTASQLEIKLPKNLGDVIYSRRYRSTMTAAIQEVTPEGKVWIIRPTGDARYRFCLVSDRPLVPDLNLSEVQIPDATPTIVAKNAGIDEQALLTKLRYNRLIDIFTGVTCYSLQNHLRTKIKSMGQVETDEIYVGVNRQGAQFVFPIQAKGKKDKLNVVQIEQDIAVCKARYPGLICRPLGAQFISADLIALIECEKDGEGEIRKYAERHYRLVPAGQISDADLARYNDRFNPE